MNTVFYEHDEAVARGKTCATCAWTHDPDFGGACGPCGEINGLGGCSEWEHPSGLLAAVDGSWVPQSEAQEQHAPQSTAPPRVGD